MFHYLLIYAGPFLGIFLEGELRLLSAVIAVAHGHLDLWAVVIIAVFATLASDSFYFYLGRKRASKWIAQSKWAPKFETVRQKLENQKIKLLLGYRFLYGFRMVTPLFLGTQTISYREFLKYSLVGTLIRASVITLLGILFAQLILTYLKHIVEQAEFYIIGLLSFTSLILIIRYISNTKRHPLKH
jgi:membrane protein DedA with SNARE-associated domain